MSGSDLVLCVLSAWPARIESSIPARCVTSLPTETPAGHLPRRRGPGIRDKRQLKEQSRRQRIAARRTLTKLLRAVTRSDKLQRNQTIRNAHLDHGYSLSQIGRAMSLHYSTISRIVNREEEIDDAQYEICPRLFITC